jgi:TRAP-type C4-dicarboxylate transport system permease small subunit
LQNKTVETLENLIDRISQISLYFSGILTLAMGFIVTYGVIMRYIFSRPAMFVYELSMMFMVSGLVFAVAYVQREGRHLRVDFLSSRMSDNTQDILFNVIMPIAGLFYVGILTWKGWDAAMYAWSVNETSQSVWREPLFPVKITITIGYGLCCLVLISQAAHGFFILKKLLKRTKQ